MSRDGCLSCIENWRTCLPHAVGFVSSLSERSRQDLSRITSALKYPDRTVICREGQVSRGVLILFRGQAKLSASSKDGNTFILRIARAGEILGLHAVISGCPHELTIETTEACVLGFVSGENFVAYLETHSDASLRVAQHISRDHQHVVKVLHALRTANSAPEKLARFLMDSSGDGNSTRGIVRTELALTHNNIAQIIGTSRETVTRTLTEFRRLNIAELNGSILTVRDPSALGRLAAV